MRNDSTQLAIKKASINAGFCAAGFVFMACFFLLAVSKAHERTIEEDLMRDE